MDTNSTAPSVKVEKTGGIKVLIIEDDQFINQLVVDNLSKSGYTLSSTKDGSSATALALKFEPDVVLLDILIPGMSGEEVLASFKKNEKLKHIPVIVFSNISEESEKIKIMELGAAEYLVKAFIPISELAIIIQKVTTKN